MCIRDSRLVVGIRDTVLSDRLQMDAELTLEKAKKAIRQKEAVTEQHQDLRGEDRKNEHSVVADVSKTPTSRPPYSRGGATNQNSRPQHKGSRQGQRANCLRCGRRKHAPGEKCPATGVICHRCKKKGHFKAQCLSKTVAETELGAAFLGTLTPETESAWMATIRLERKEIQFKLDTGAGVTAISEKTYQNCLLYTSPSPRDATLSRMPSSA